MKTASDRVLLLFQGNLTEELISYLVHFAEKSFLGAGVPILVQKRVINVLVESVQNIFHHSSKRMCGPLTVTIAHLKDKYRISATNFVDDQKTAELERKLKKAVSMNKEELRRHYIKKLGEKVSEKPAEGMGAGIGILDMARRSNQKVSYCFEETEDKNSKLFTLSVDIKAKL